MNPSLRRALLACAFALAVAACSSPEQREAEYVERGLALLEEGDVSRAAVNLRNALRINPRNAQALYAMGRINEQQERYPQAYNAYLAAADADPTLIEAHNAYAVLALTGNQLEIVEDAIEKIAAVDPGHPDGLALEAAVALRKPDVDAAEAAARRALEAAPGHVNATSALAGVYNARGERNRAVELLDAHFAAHGPNVPLALLQIQLFAAANDLAGVEGGFRQLIDFAPDNADFRIALSNFYRSQERNVDAESVLRTAVDALGNDSTTTAALVQLVYGTSGLDAAIAEADRLLQRVGDDRVLDFLIADMLSREGRLADARARLNGVVEALGADSPRGLDAITALAGLDLADDRPVAAQERLDQVLASDRQHRGANYLVGTMRLAAGDAAEAITAARTALARDPDWVPGLRLVAEAHAARGEAELATEALARVVALAPADLAAAERLARLLTERGEYDRALEIWDQIVARAEDPSAALANTAELAIRQQNWNRATRDIDRLLEGESGQLSGALLAGSMRLARGDYEGGRAWFARAGEIEPNAPQPLFGLVQSFLAEDDVEGALGAIDGRLREAPEDAVAWNVKAQLHARDDDDTAARMAYRRAMEAQPGWITPYRELAQLEESRGNVDAAIAVLDEGIAADAGAPTLYLQRAFVEQRAERFLAAIDTYERLLDLGSNDDVVVNNFGALVADFAYEDSARMQRAVELAGRFQSSTEAYFIDTLGWLHYRKGDVAAGLALLRRSAALRPDDAQLQYHVGAALVAAGEHQQARTHLERAVVTGADYTGLDEARRLLEELDREPATAVTSGNPS